MRIMASLLADWLISQLEHDRRNDLGRHGLFDHQSDGVDIQITANATKKGRFQANYTLTDAVEENRFSEWKAWHALNLADLSQFTIIGIVTSAARTIAQ